MLSFLLSCQISIFVLVSLRAEQLVISRPPKISPLALGFVKSARDSCCLPLVFICVLRSVRTGFCAPVFSASDVLVLVSAPKYFSLPGVRSAPARTRISLLRSARSPQLQLFSQHNGRFPFGLCLACLSSAPVRIATLRFSPVFIVWLLVLVPSSYCS
jgi:hypothetical protein